MINIDILEKYAKNKLEENLAFEREFIFVLPDGEHKSMEIPKYSVPLENITLKALRLLIKNRNIKQYFMIFESWMGNNINVRPSEDSKRREALLILEFNENHKNKCVFQFFKKENNKIIYEEKMEDFDYAHSETKFNFFKDADEIEKNIDKFIYGTKKKKFKQ